jgi:hypothetical protein
LNGSKNLLMRRESQWTGRLTGSMMPVQRLGRIMLKVINQWSNEDGFPVLHWEQMVPTGESLHSAEQGLALKIAAVIGVFVFAAVCCRFLCDRCADSASNAAVRLSERRNLRARSMRFVLML